MMENNQNIDINNLELASLNTRVKAFLIDDILITFLTIVMLWDRILNVGDDTFAILTIMNDAFFQIVLLKFLYQSFFIWYYGATIGKIIMKIKVIDFYNFGKVDFITAILRSSTRIVSESIFYIGFLFSYYTHSRQTFHDKIAKTLVVNV